MKGFVLVNALVVVAALAAASAVMLARAGGAAARAGAGLEAAQLALYLDGWEALAIEMLDRDRPTPSDHAGEAWAQPRTELELDRGRVSGRIVDLQGRFNLNWLADAEDAFAHAAFERLLTALGIPAARAGDIREHLRPGGPDDARPYLAGDPPTRPWGGAVAVAAQIREVPRLSEDEWARLAPHVAAYPGALPLNLNTAGAPVLASLLPGTGPSAAAAFVAEARRRPFGSAEEALAALSRLSPGGLPKEMDPSRFGIASRWFATEARARLGGRSASRFAVLERMPSPGPVRVAYRADDWR